LRSTGIRGVYVSIEGGTLVVRSKKPLRTLSSAILNGGLANAYSIVNHQVPTNYTCNDSESYLKRALELKRNVKFPVIGLMTAAKIRNFALTRMSSSRLTVATIVTVGLSYPATAGDKTSVAADHAGTINIILLIDGNPTDACMVNIVETATEAKAAALHDLDIRSRFSREASTGTTTDAVIVASTRRGRAVEYAGSATTLGYLVARTVRTGIEQAAAKVEGISRQRSMVHRLQERGITLDALVKAGMELFIGAKSTSFQNTRALLREELRKSLADINVAALMLAAVRLEEDAKRGLIPELSSEAFRQDPVILVADECIGSQIANYLAGTWGTYNFLRYDRFKPGIISKLGPFMDDAVAGLVGGTLAKIMLKR